MLNDKDVVVLTDLNFNELVMESNDLWLVDFYAPWCGHCKTLEPQWNIAASELRGKAKLGKVDCTKNNETSKRFEVGGFPTIKIFPPGAKSDKTVENYEVKNILIFFSK